MNLSRKNRTEGKNRAKKGRTVKSSYAGYDSRSQSLDLSTSIKPISDNPSEDPNFLGKQTSDYLWITYASRDMRPCSIEVAQLNHCDWLGRFWFPNNALNIYWNSGIAITFCVDWILKFFNSCKLQWLARDSGLCWAASVGAGALGIDGYVYNYNPLGGRFLNNNMIAFTSTTFYDHSAQSFFKVVWLHY